MREKIRELIEQGMTQKQITEITGLKKSTIRYHADKLKMQIARQTTKPREKKETKPRKQKPLKGSLCGHCGNAWPSRCGKIRTGEKVYTESKIIPQYGKDTMWVTKCPQYISDDEIDRPKFYEHLNTDIKYSDVGNDRKYARGSNIKRRR